MKREKLLKHLTAHGCVLFKEGAKHSHWINPRDGSRTIIGRHRDVPTHTARGICRQLNVSPPPGR